MPSKSSFPYRDWWIESVLHQAHGNQNDKHEKVNEKTQPLSGVGQGQPLSLGVVLLVGFQILFPVT